MPLPLESIVFLSALLAMALGAQVFSRRQSPSRPSQPSWLRAYAFFVVALLIGQFSGVYALLPLQQPPPSPAAWAALAGYAIVVAAGYGWVWPKGTVCHGRPLRPAAAVLFGMAWGVAQGVVFLSIWLWIARLGLGVAWTAVLTYFAIAAYQGVWHGLYWDIKVSPPHNLKSWNARKVALVHTPNLLVTLAFLAVFGLSQAWAVVLMQCLALVLSCWFMHFPWPTDPPAPVPEPDD